jgi:hypothetical protein
MASGLRERPVCPSGKFAKASDDRFLEFESNIYPKPSESTARDEVAPKLWCYNYIFNKLFVEEVGSER